VSAYLLDSSYVVDLLNELADDRDGPAVRWLVAHPRAELWISPVTLAEVLEGAADPDAVEAYLTRFRWQGIHRAHAVTAARRQRRRRQRLGENDAWQAAIALLIGAAVLGHDRAFRTAGVAYEDHRRA
jgi:predicted nucleic acid-binding protein